MLCYTRNYEETIFLGKTLAAILQKEDVVCLYGGLGAGKTALVAGILSGLGYADTISSPTFTIVNEYDTAPPVFHFDVYRVHDADALEAIGFEEYFEREGIILIEWAELIPDLLPQQCLQIYIHNDPLEAMTREIRLVGCGESYIKRLERVHQKWERRGL